MAIFLGMVQSIFIIGPITSVVKVYVTCLLIQRELSTQTEEEIEAEKEELGFAVQTQFALDGQVGAVCNPILNVMCRCMLWQHPEMPDQLMKRISKMELLPGIMHFEDMYLENLRRNTHEINDFVSYLMHQLVWVVSSKRTRAKLSGKSKTFIVDALEAADVIRHATEHWPNPIDLPDDHAKELLLTDEVEFVLGSLFNLPRMRTARQSAVVVLDPHLVLKGNSYAYPSFQIGLTLMLDLNQARAHRHLCEALLVHDVCRLLGVGVERVRLIGMGADRSPLTRSAEISPTAMPAEQVEPGAGADTKRLVSRAPGQGKNDIPSMYVVMVM